MSIQQAFQSQYFAALKMLREAIVRCPPSIWDSPRDRDRTWFKAYHTVYWANSYLPRSVRKVLAPWRGRGAPNDWKGHRKRGGRAPISKKDLLEYLGFLEQRVVEIRSYPRDRLERQLANLRHIQQHTGELYERLGSRQPIQLHWTEEVHRKIS
jgi:hypothetical protein